MPTHAFSSDFSLGTKNSHHLARVSFLHSPSLTPNNALDMATMGTLTLPIVESSWTLHDHSKFHDSNKLDSSSNATSSDRDGLPTLSEITNNPIIEYAYDPLPALPIHLKQQAFQLPSGATVQNGFSSQYSLKLDPLSAGLPYRCSLDYVHANKFWKSNLGEMVDLLTLLAEDDSAHDIEVDRGITLAKLARKALRPGLEHEMVLATHYMFPCADEHMTKLKSALMIIYFVFDGALSR